MSSSPGLVYLTIYNPALAPTDTSVVDDEDALEQAQILFYTSKERAVSRDRMLRQVGLAKAISNFSDMFSPPVPHSSVHSHMRRMIMVSPEPNFWINAYIDLARSQREIISKPKGKHDKMQSKDKPKAPNVVYDYHDPPLHDLALQASILRGYEMFKLKHGSFVSIIQTLGKEALELQLERFFTVWAWSWDLEIRHEFGDHLASISLHPLHSRVLPLIDDLSTRLPPHICPVIICPPSSIPSTDFTTTYANSYLPRFLIDTLSSVPSSPRLDESLPLPVHEYDTQPSEKEHPLSNTGNAKFNKNGTFLGLPAMNINMNNVNSAMDVRKWNWPGYLTFGKGSAQGRLPGLNLTRPPAPMDQPPDQSSATASIGTDIAVDHGALEDAMSSCSVSILTPDPEASTLDPSDFPQAPDAGTQTLDGPLPDDSSSASSSSGNVDFPFQPSVFSLFLARKEDIQSTQRVRVSCFTKSKLTVAMINATSNINDTSEEYAGLTELIVGLLDEVERIMKTQPDADDPPQSAIKVLQPKDKSVAEIGGCTLSLSGFTSSSEHLYNSRQLQSIHPDVVEIYSRGQNAQHFYAAKRGGDGNMVYLEVGRKEASLSDVENVLASAVKRIVE